MTTTEPAVQSRITEVTFCALPQDDIDHGSYAVQVSWRGGDRYAVTRHRRSLGADGEWDWEPIPSEREDEWLATHRFDYDTACALAAKACQHVVVNGITVADALDRAARRDR